MEIRQLKYFVGVAESGSFSEASRRFYLSQSAISQQIKALEDEIGTALFVRSSHHLSLTESGQMLLPLARRVMQDVNLCQEQMADLQDMLCGELTIGLTFSLEPYVRPTIVRFLKSFPKVRLNLFYKSIPELRSMLRRHEVDMTFSVEHPEDQDEIINAEPVMEYKLCAILRDTHPLASHDILNFSDLSLQNFVLPEAGIRDRNAVELYLHKHTGDVNVRAIINEPNSLLNIVGSTNYVTILSERIVVGREGLCAVEIEELSAPVTAYAQTLRGTYQKRSARTFLNMLREDFNATRGL